LPHYDDGGFLELDRLRRTTDLLIDGVFMLLRSLGERIKGGVALRSLPRLRTYINGVEPVLQQSVVRPLLARDVPPLYKRVSQVRHLRRMAAKLVPSDSTTSPCVGPPASHTPSPIDNPGLFLPLRYARTGQSHRSNLYLMRRSHSRTARARRWRRRRRSESHRMPRSNKANDLACRSRRARFREYKF
jgi:hypothetical protein